MPAADPFNARAILTVNGTNYTYFRLAALAKAGLPDPGRLPFSIRILLESMLRSLDGFIVTADDVSGMASWNAAAPAQEEIPFMPGRVVLQDFTGVPCLVDLAAMRDAMARLGGNPADINPAVPCDLVIDHSVQVDEYGSRVALTINAQREFERNNERYRFLKWGQQSLSNFRVVPPATGIVHQVNLEYLAAGTLTKQVGGELQAFPDSLVGTDSHTTMINGLGVLGWGVGGIEAEAVMLGQPVYMLTPEVIGVQLKGRLPEGTTATDLVLTVTEMLRAHGVVEKFVEFFGEGMAELSIPDRATIANMAPEYGATCGFFPIDVKTIEYLRFTGRVEQAALTEAYARANMLWWQPGTPDPTFTAVLELDLATIQPSLAGPRRPQDRVQLSQMKATWHKELVDTFGKAASAELTNQDRWADEGGESARAQESGETMAAVNVATTYGVPKADAGKGTAASGVAALCPIVAFGGRAFRVHHGDVVIAAITSCTNTSNPDVMVAAGLVARKARAMGLTSKPWVKTSLAPGSKVVTEYYDKAGLTEDLEALGFHTVGYGCTTCIGNSGPLPAVIEAGIKQGDLIAASVLSGNRNFEGRVHPAVKANYLASPPLVVAYAIAGTVNVDLLTQPIGVAQAGPGKGQPVFLKDIWPTQAEVRAIVESCITPGQYKDKYANVFTGNPTWNAVPVSRSESYPWDDGSTYIQNPPFFEGMTPKPPAATAITGARCLAFLGDSVTTDHISPAGDIAEKSPAGAYLVSKGVPKSDFNSYGSRRGNDRVMTRGTFANVRVRNKLAAGVDGKIPEGGWTRDFTRATADGAWKAPVSSIYDAAQSYKAARTPLIVLAGKDYGMGSSRDWAAKGAFLLGVRAVLAQSFERIHRSNLVFMGVMPLVFKDGQTAAGLGLDGTEVFDLEIPAMIEPRCDVGVTATRTHGPEAGKQVRFAALCRIDTRIEIEYYRNGGILHTVIRKKLNESKVGAGV